MLELDRLVVSLIATPSSHSIAYATASQTTHVRSGLLA